MERRCNFCNTLLTNFCPDCGAELNVENLLCGYIIPKNHCGVCEGKRIRGVDL